MPRVHLTDRSLRSLSTEKVQEDFWDTVLPGFGVRVGRGGGRSFFVRFRGAGKQRRLLLGSYPAVSLAEARDKARGIAGDLARDIDPVQEVEAARAGLTFAELAEKYLERHARVHKRSWEEDRRILDKEILPSWAGRRAAEVRKGDVLTVLDVVVDRGAPIMANRTLALIRKVFNWGLGRDLVEHNPCLGVARPAPERRRDRVLSYAEIRRLWRTWEGECQPVRTAFQLLLLTAQRSGEVRAMCWNEISDGRWTLPAARTKAKRAHVVPLSRQVEAILGSLLRSDGDPWVVGSPRVPGEQLYESSLSHSCRRLRSVVGFEWRAHDLRRTAASHMTALGISRLVVSQILNHADNSVTAIYDRHSYLPEMRQALQAWADEVDRILAVED